MNNTVRQQIEALLSQPEKLLKKKPFYREVTDRSGNLFSNAYGNATVDLTATVTATLPNVRLKMIPQAQFMEELDVNSHKVLFDDNIPSFTVKLKKGGFLEIEQYRIPIPFQKLILNKQVRHLCVNTINHTLLNTKPTDRQQANFIRYKQAWVEKNMEGAKTAFVRDAKSYGDAGLLFFIDSDKKLRTKNINFKDGYVIITHKNDEGKHILECLYYAVTDNNGNTTTYIDCYDDEYMTRFTTSTADGGTLTESGWIRHEPVRHGFSECPLITKRVEVAWNNGQKAIESYEALYNTVLVIYKKFGHGIIYVKGKFNQNAKKIATNVVLNDTSMDEKADAKVLEMPEPAKAVDMLDYMEQTIMKACGTTFILPKDIKISGDTSGLAVELTQELDMATAQDGVVEWQNVANKMSRLFKEGLAMELVNNGEKGFEKAITEFDELRIFSEFRVWKPKSEEAHNQMLTALYQSGNGGISRQTFVEKNTVSAPDEMERIKKEQEEQMALEQKKAEQTMELEIKKQKATSSNTNSNASAQNQ